MAQKIKIVQYGCGKMGRLIMAYALKKGCDIVAAFDADSQLWGCDIGDIIALRPLGITIKPAYTADLTLSSLEADILVIATESSLKDVAPLYRLAISHGLNAISTAEEAIFPWNSAPFLAEELAREAKKAHCTISASGYNDFAWGLMAQSLASVCANIRLIRGASMYNVADYGAALCRSHGLGLSEAEFNRVLGCYNDLNSKALTKLIQDGLFSPSYMWNQNAWLASALGLNIIGQTQRLTPYIAKSPHICQPLALTITPGKVSGLKAEVMTETAEGITIISENSGKIFEAKDEDYNRWSITGEPSLSFEMALPPTSRLTAGAIVARIPQIINAYPGYLTTDKLPLPTFSPLPLSL